MQEVFDIGNFRFILDRLHCKQHLSSAGEALEPMTAVPTQQWAHEALEKLEAGQVATVVVEMHGGKVPTISQKKRSNRTA